MSKLILVLFLAFSAAFARVGPDDPLDDLMYYEQNYMVPVNGDPDVFEPDTNLQALRFRPAPGRRFKVKTYWIEAARIQSYLARSLADYPEIREQMIREINGRTYYRFFVHPESEVFYREYLEKSGAIPAADYWAEPGASSRTLRVYREGHKELSFFAKLSLNRIIGEVRRTLKGSELARSVGTTNTLAFDEGRMPDEFMAFPEVMGLIPPGMERGGMLIRALPAKFKEDKTLFIPLFALYGRKDASQPTLLEAMIEKSGMEADKFVVARIIRPFLKLWLKLELEHGITMEAHGQNVLIGLKDGLPDGNFGFRDFGGFNIDIDFRAESGIGNSELPVATTLAKDYMASRHRICLRESLNDYFTAGVMYDLDQIFAAEWRKRGYGEDHLREAVRLELNKMLQEINPRLPPLYRGFSNLAQIIENQRAQETAAAGRRYACERRLRRLKAK